MMVLKKKEVVATALVVLIGVAGNLNWSYQDTIRVTDGESYLEEAKKLGEAEYVNSEKEDVEKDGEGEAQKLHDKFIKRVDEMMAAKEKEIMTV